MSNIIETEFHLVSGREEPIYNIVSSNNELLGIVYRKIIIKPMGWEYHICIDYNLIINQFKKFNASEIRMVKYYYNNLVSTLTRDIQSVYVDNINDRFSLPFYENIMHLEIIK